MTEEQLKQWAMDHNTDFRIARAIWVLTAIYPEDIEERMNGLWEDPMDVEISAIYVLAVRTHADKPAEMQWGHETLADVVAAVYDRSESIQADGHRHIMTQLDANQ